MTVHGGSKLAWVSAVSVTLQAQEEGRQGMRWKIVRGGAKLAGAPLPCRSRVQHRLKR